ncbi:MAG: hypothetical protein WDN02_11950 [Methylovirgula sp.]|uniref:hypothetical protein n=1 Tax=Methylovirgula sp. TaxID=1978224 RepID=UPI0030767DD1
MPSALSTSTSVSRVRVPGLQGIGVARDRAMEYAAGNFRHTDLGRCAIFQTEDGILRNIDLRAQHFAMGDVESAVPVD